MPGPRIQMPPSVSQMFEIQKDERGQVVQLNLRPDWAALLTVMADTIQAASRYGTSAQRPTSTMTGRFVGMPFYDTTLGLPVFLKTASSNAWVKADGTAA